MSKQCLGLAVRLLYDFAFQLEIDLHVEYYTPVSSMCPSNESVLVIFFIYFFFISNRVFQIKCRYDSNG